MKDNSMGSVSNAGEAGMQPLGKQRWQSSPQLTPVETVARIAYLSSDVVVSVQPSLAADSEFSNYLKDFHSEGLQNIVSDAISAVRSRLRYVQDMND